MLSYHAQRLTAHTHAHTSTMHRQRFFAAQRATASRPRYLILRPYRRPTLLRAFLTRTRAPCAWFALSQWLRQQPDTSITDRPCFGFNPAFSPFGVFSCPPAPRPLHNKTRQQPALRSATRPIHNTSLGSSQPEAQPPSPSIILH